MIFNILLFLGSLFFMPLSSVLADVVYPIGGTLSSTNTQEIDFRNFSCESDTKAEEVSCRMSVTQIQPLLDEIMTKEELLAVAKRDGLNVNSLITMCAKMTPFFEYLDGKSIDGQVITDKQRQELKAKSAAMGFEKELLASMKTICGAPSETAIVDLMDQMQKAQSRVCKVTNFLLAERSYKLDERTGKFINSEINDGLCDQYVYTEVISVDDFGIGSIKKYEEKRTFLQKLEKDEKRRVSLGCDKEGEYEDRVFVQKDIYFPLTCVSFKQ